MPPDGLPRAIRAAAPQAPRCRAFAALVENDDDGPFGNDIGDRDRFFGAPPLGILRAAFANFDDFDVTQAEAASDRFGALAIGRGEFALGSLLQAADGGDETGA